MRYQTGATATAMPAVDALRAILGHHTTRDGPTRNASAGKPTLREGRVAGSAGVTPAYVGLEPTLILPIDPPRPSIVLRRAESQTRRDSEQGASRHDGHADR